jgi:glycolate oxidase iron-sulfur subunit
LCLSHCPTYLETGNENDSPRGRIYLMRAVETGRQPLDATTVRHFDLCLGCRACEAACPSGVEYGALLETTREHIEQNYRRSAWQTFLRRVAIEQVFPFPARMRWAVRLGRLLPKWLNPALELLPEPVEVTLPEFSPAIGERRGQVGLVTGCVQSVLFGDVNAATMKLLNRAGYDVVVPRRQVCCGALYAHSGNLAKAREVARQNMAAFADVDLVVVNAAGCGSTMKEYGPPFAAKVRDLSEVIQPSAFSNQPSAKVTFHDACHLAYAQRITAQPRALVKAIAGEQYVELPEAAVCCGSAGSYNLTEPAMAEQLQRRKVENILATGALTVVTTNPGCILQIRAGLERAGWWNVRVVHLATWLAETC